MDRFLSIAALCAAILIITAGSAQAEIDPATMAELQALEHEAEVAMDRTELGMVAPPEPIAGECVDGVSHFASSPLEVGQLQECGPPPADPTPALEEAGALLGELEAEIEVLQEDAKRADDLLGQLNGGPAAPVGPTPIFITSLALVPAFLRPLFTAYLNDLSFIAQTFAQVFRVGPFSGDPFDPPEGALRAGPPGAVAAAHKLSRAEAWARLVAIRGRLRVLTGHSTPRAPTVRLRAKRREPVLVFGCQAERCPVAIRPVLQIGRDRTRLPTQRLTVKHGQRAVVREALSPDQLRAVRRAGRGTLALTIVAGGQVETVHVQLTP